MITSEKRKTSSAQKMACFRAPLPADAYPIGKAREGVLMILLVVVLAPPKYWEGRGGEGRGGKRYSEKPLEPKLRGR